MALTLIAMEKYDIFNFPKEIRVNILPLIAPQISNYIAGNPNRDLVLNLSSVTFLDSSTIKLLVNLHKRMDTWFMQVLSEKARYNLLHVSKSYFILIIAAISLSKAKEAASLFADFSALMKSLPDSIASCASGFNSPAFWFSQARFIWEKNKAATAA